MSDSGFREVQLSGKQVVFLFIAGVVALVSVFLLGVSVGKGVIQPDAVVETTPTPTAEPTPAGTPGVMPPSTAPAPGELKYHETLQSKPESAGAPRTTPTPTPTPTATPTPTPTPAKPTSPPVKSVATAVWFVQMGAFSTTQNAQKQISELKAKGFAASMVDDRATRGRYKVKFGPMERAAADALRGRLLKEGFKPSPVSR